MNNDRQQVEKLPTWLELDMPGVFSLTMGDVNVFCSSCTRNILDSDSILLSFERMGNTLPSCSAVF